MKDDFVFPRTGSGAPGMELRDWFAGMAMQRVITRMDQYDYDSAVEHTFWRTVSQISYEIADTMMRERNKGQK